MTTPELNDVTLDVDPTGSVASTQVRPASRLPRWVPPFLLALAAVIAVMIHVPQHDRISPIDEYAYIDYVAKVPDQGVVRQGEKTGDFARRYLLCHGVAVLPDFGPNTVACADPDATVNDRSFPHGGFATSDIYTPLYFGVAWAVAEGLGVFGVDLVDAARLSGALWLALAAVLLYLGALWLGASRSAAGAASLLMTASPLAFWSNTYVSTDATAFFAGSLILVLGLGVINGRVKPMWFAVASVLVLLLKFQNFVAVGAMVLTFILLVLDRRFRGRSPRTQFRRDPLVRAALLAVGASVIAQIVWVAVRAAIATGESPDQGVGSPWSLVRIAIDATTFFPGVMDTPNSAADTGQFLVVWLLKLLIIGGVLSAIFASRRSEIVGHLATSALVVGILAAPLLALVIQVIAGGYIIPVARYGAALVPFFMVTVAVMLSRRRYVGKASLVLAIGVFAFSLVTFG